MVKALDLISIIEQEGLGYAVMNYYTSSSTLFEDEVLGSLWLAASDALMKLEIKLGVELHAD